MKESYGEGLANHAGPESCGYSGNGVSEALTGVHAGRVLSHESTCLLDRSADAVAYVGRQHWTCRNREADLGSARSKTPCTYGNSSHRNWDIPCSALHQDGNKARTVNPNGVMQ
jgi:hypothetical protein